MIRIADRSSRPASGRAALATLLAIAALPAIVAAVGLQEGAPDGAPISVPAPAQPPPLAAGPIPDLDLLFTAQVIGWIEPCG